MFDVKNRLRSNSTGNSGSLTQIKNIKGLKNVNNVIHMTNRSELYCKYVGLNAKYSDIAILLM